MKSDVRRHGAARVDDEAAGHAALPPKGAGSVARTGAGTVTVRPGVGCIRVELAGEIDTEVAEDLREATVTVELSGLPIEVDARRVLFMDSTGGAFLARLAIRSAVRVRLVGAPPEVRFLLEVTRIGDLLEMVDEPCVEGGRGSPPS